ncbi:small multi-drug export protein [Alkalihalobacillus pseudalcaliphilus]|uniref:small multi-drug export protein n=1 Tax=Alkalihalobacillus pseudalcaliphilus TaxID=79884 RepID=UPI00069DC758|nr:small multi-drug export protein [Alkalihalobacillus pseudalcaliphilus]
MGISKNKRRLKGGSIIAHFIAYIIIFLAAATPFIEVVFTIPVGAIAGLNVWLVTFVATFGNVLTVVIVIALADRIREWQRRRNAEKGKVNKKNERAEKIMSRFGLPGLALLGPVFVGSHLAVLLAISLGSSKKHVTSWVLGSVIGWGIITGIASYYALDFFQFEQESGFLYDLIERFNQ